MTAHLAPRQHIAPPYRCSQCGSTQRPRHTMRDVGVTITTVWGICKDCDNEGQRRRVHGRHNPKFNPLRPRWNVVAIEFHGVSR